MANFSLEQFFIFIKMIYKIFIKKVRQILQHFKNSIENDFWHTTEKQNLVLGKIYIIIKLICNEISREEDEISIILLCIRYRRKFDYSANGKKVKRLREATKKKK